MEQVLQNKNRIKFLNYNKKQHLELLEYSNC